jgi:hypothetical protein
MESVYDALKELNAQCLIVRSAVDPVPWNWARVPPRWIGSCGISTGCALEKRVGLIPGDSAHTPVIGRLACLSQGRARAHGARDAGDYSGTYMVLAGLPGPLPALQPSAAPSANPAPALPLTGWTASLAMLGGAESSGSEAPFQDGQRLRPRLYRRPGRVPRQPTRRSVP